MNPIAELKVFVFVFNYVYFLYHAATTWVLIHEVTSTFRRYRGLRQCCPLPYSTDPAIGLSVGESWRRGATIGDIVDQFLLYG